MKCDTCKNNIFHPADTWQAVAEGGSDPYAYYYCSKNHWDSDPGCLGLDFDYVDDEDPWEDCKDYKEKGK
jgi:hypothetical protein